MEFILLHLGYVCIYNGFVKLYEDTKEWFYSIQHVNKGNIQSRGNHNINSHSMNNLYVTVQTCKINAIITDTFLF